MAAAVAARRAGASVALIDEYAAPGGQIWRRRFDEVGEAAPRSLPARRARALAGFAASGATAARGPLRLGRARAGRAAAHRRRSPARVRARAVVLATGAYDRPVAFPGWTLPGVMTAGGAQALAKGQGVLPGRRVLLAGAGPVPAAGRRAAGGRRAPRSSPSPRRRAGATGCAPAPRMARLPRAARRLRALPDAGAPDRLGPRDRARRGRRPRADGDDRRGRPGLGAERPRAHLRGRRRLHGLRLHARPSSWPARSAASCARRASPTTPTWRTTVAGVFVAGEAAGRRRRRPRAGRGRARRLRRGRVRDARSGPTATARPPPSEPADLAALRARRAKLAGLRGHPRRPLRPAARLLGLATPDTVLCRCEDVTAGAIDAAVADGATTMSALKIVTRCGQGPCQGRVCERLVCERLPEPERFSARAPIRPIPLGVLMDVATDSSSTA